VPTRCWPGALALVPFDQEGRQRMAPGRPHSPSAARNEPWHSWSSARAAAGGRPCRIMTMAAFVSPPAARSASSTARSSAPVIKPTMRAERLRSSQRPPARSHPISPSLPRSFTVGYAIAFMDGLSMRWCWSRAPRPGSAGVRQTLRAGGCAPEAARVLATERNEERLAEPYRESGSVTASLKAGRRVRFAECPRACRADCRHACPTSSHRHRRSRPA
jgi:hypothetical protein